MTIAGILRIVTLCCAVVFAFLGGRVAAGLYLRGLPVSELSVEQAQQLKAEQLADRAPKLPEGRTYLEGARSSGKTLILEIGVSEFGRDMDVRGFLGAMKITVIDLLCNDRGERRVLNRGGDRVYIYHDANGSYIGKFHVTAGDC